MVLKCYYNNPAVTEMPKWIRVIVLNWLAKIVRVKVPAGLINAMEKHVQEQEEVREEIEFERRNSIFPRPLRVKGVSVPLETSNQSLAPQVHHIVSEVARGRYRQSRENLVLKGRPCRQLDFLSYFTSLRAACNPLMKRKQIHGHRRCLHPVMLLIQWRSSRKRHCSNMTYY